ncbi:MAG: type II toxin-antitoxin system HicB family antitoxin [Dehalococcoidia bacterium]
MQRYSVVLIPEPDEGGYSVIVPLLPGCATQGETVEAALANAQDAIAGYLQSLIAHGDYIPEEQIPAFLVQVEVNRGL